MKLEVKPFQSLSAKEKLDFFLAGQKLLLEFHPQSDFIIQKHQMKERLAHLEVMARQYKGLTYRDENICVLFNKINIADSKDAVTALRDCKYKEASKDFNAVSIDFVVFRKLEDCMEWCRANYDPRIQHVLYVKNGKPQIYKTEELIAKVFSVPKASFPTS